MSQLEQSTSNFLQQVSEYQGEYASDREFAVDKKLREAQLKEAEGAEILNVAAPSAFKIFSRGLARGNVAGKITKTLDDYESTLSPAARSTFRLVRNVAADVVGAAPGKLGEVARGADDVIRGNPERAQEQAPAPTAEEQREPDALPAPEPEAQAAIQEEQAPTPAMVIPDSDDPREYVPTVKAKLRQIGKDDIADALETRVTKGAVNAAYKALKAQEGDPESTQLAARWGDAVNKYKASLAQATAPPTEPKDQFDPSLLPEGAGGRVAPAAPVSAAAAPAGAAAQVNEATRPNVEPGYRVLADVSRDVTRGKAAANSAAADVADTAVDATTSALGLASSALKGKAQEATADTALAVTSARELAAGELPTGALLTGVDAGLARLGAGGREAAGAINTTVTGANVARQVGGIASRLAGRGAAKASVDPAITAESTAESTTNQAVKALGQAVGKKVGQAAAEEGGEIGEVAAGGGDAGEGLVSSLGQAALGSLAGDENPIGWGVTAALGLAAGLASLGTGIKDIFEHHHTNVHPNIAQPSFQAGISQ